MLGFYLQPQAVTADFAFAAPVSTNEEAAKIAAGAGRGGWVGRFGHGGRRSLPGTGFGVHRFLCGFSFFQRFLCGFCFFKGFCAGFRFAKEVLFGSIPLMVMLTPA